LVKRRPLFYLNPSPLFTPLDIQHLIFAHVILTPAPTSFSRPAPPDANSPPPPRAALLFLRLASSITHRATLLLLRFRRALPLPGPLPRCWCRVPRPTSSTSPPCFPTAAMTPSNLTPVSDLTHFQRSDSRFQLTPLCCSRCLLDELSHWCCSPSWTASPCILVRISCSTKCVCALLVPKANCCAQTLL
jgi:hypothetical protein